MKISQNVKQDTSQNVKKKFTVEIGKKTNKTVVNVKMFVQNEISQTVEIKTKQRKKQCQKQNISRIN